MYTILKELGHGHFATVYLLEIPEGGKVALKLQRTSSPATLIEPKLLSKLEHPHLIRYFHCFIRASQIYLITEFCERGTLREYIEIQNRDKKPVVEPIVLRMLCQLSDVLRYLYVSRIIHRDFKTENIFLDKHKNIKVGDVGVARELDYTSQEVDTFAGTPCYMAPEVLSCQNYTTKADIWSLGCCTHELMTLQRTFTTREDIFKINIPDMPEIYRDDLHVLVYQMLKNDPDRRPDAYDILNKACEMRDKRYKPAEIIKNVICEEINERAVFEAILCFQKTAFDVEDRESSSSTQTTSACSRSKVRLKSSRKSQKQHKTSTSSSREGTPSSNSSSGSMISDSKHNYRDVISSFTPDSTVPQDSLDARVSTTEYETLDTVTLYTRAQKVKYEHKPQKQQSLLCPLSPLELRRSTERVFADQNENLRELMLKRVMGHFKDYTLDGEPMLHHKPF